MSRSVSRRGVLGGVGAAVVTGALLPPAAAVATSAAALPASRRHREDTVLWQLGNVDPGAGSASEFSDYRPADPEMVTVPTDWRSRTTWDTVLSKGLKASVNRAMEISYNLDRTPVHGAEFRVKITNAHRSIPQMAVFSNGTMVGLIQIAGVAGAANSQYPYVKTYRLYIPKEFLRWGTNVLRLEAVRSFSGTGAEDQYTWWTWDHLQLMALGRPAPEPVHGRSFHLGTMIAQRSFGYNPDALRHLPVVLEWLGIAYSGNVLRAGFWSDLPSTTAWRTHGLAYLQRLTEFNMRVLGNHLNARQHPLNPDGTLSQEDRDSLDSYLDTYGDYIQFYEVDNEPGLFKSSKASNIAIANYFRQSAATRAPHVKLVAPGWAYWPKNGDPDGWARNPDHRRDVEELCDLTGGHSYGPSYAAGRGSSFVENLLTYGPITDGLPKEMLVTETGTVNVHVDDPIYGASQPNAASFDRIMRAHVGYADYVMQHAAFFSNYQLFNNDFDWPTHDPETTQAYSFGPDQQTRVDIFRRIALAYATHGAPLPYTYLNADELNNRKVYTRAVDTATLAPLPGSGATSNKVLINVVNFDNTPLAVSVRVTMPAFGIWRGVRINGGNGDDAYNTARMTVSKLALPTIKLNVPLAPGEAVQYILARLGRVMGT